MAERVLLQIKDYVMNDEYNVSTKTKVKRVEINADHASVNEQAGILCW